MDIKKLLYKSKTAYHAVKNAAEILDENGFLRLNENNDFKIEKGGKYYIIRNDSALIAFTVGKKSSEYYKIIASHTDSPCFKVKFGKNPVSDGVAKIAVEQYGGGLRYTWFDRPLKLAGRLCGEKNGKIYSTLYTSEENYVIPSVAIHFRRNANEGFAVNPQIDCQPLYSLNADANILKSNLEKAFNGKLLDADLYLVSDDKPFSAGANNELLCAPRIDNLTSCFSSIFALLNASNEIYTNVIYLADNEEIGSRTEQGAASKYLYDTLERINNSLEYTKEAFLKSLAKSFMVSCDNAHAVHPNHPELSDTLNEVTLSCGVVIKHHANKNYTTDGMTAAYFKNILQKNDIPYSDFYMRSDMPCGGTLGTISSSQVSIKSVDIGIAQLAMHSALETISADDYDRMISALTAFFNDKDVVSF